MDAMEKIVSLCKRRGFIFPSSEIYGGLNGAWDYGPLGVELKRNLKQAWWDDMVAHHDETATPPGAPQPFGMVGLDSALLMNPKVWEASGHVGGFSDPMVDDRETRARYRADQLAVYALEFIGSDGKLERYDEVLFAAPGELGKSTPAELFEPHRKRVASLQKSKPGREARPVAVPGALQDEALRARVLAPGASAPGTLTAPRAFNLMFKTHVGALEDNQSVTYLRPETAQGIFVNFKNVTDTARVRVPFGIGQIGKAFRNEINPRNFTFRSREFEQMEIEFFCRAGEAAQWYQFWRERRFQWYLDLGIRPDKLRIRDHDKDELAHYSVATCDVEYEYPFGWGELEGIACRTDFDLKRHSEASGVRLEYFDPDTKEHYTPFVIEPAGGIDRMALTFLIDAYAEEEVEGETRVVLRLHPRIAPITVGVFPLVKKDGMPELAHGLEEELRELGFTTFYDEKAAIGRRYRRQDEVGTPWCVTIDGETPKDGTVTVRERDSMQQVRVPLREVGAHLREAQRTWRKG